MTNYQTQLDEIDQWLADNFGILPGACSSTENLRHNTARMIAEALWPKCKETLPKDLEEAAKRCTTCIIGRSTIYGCPATSFDVTYVQHLLEEVFIDGAEWQKEQDFTHHEADESLQEAVTHQMEDEQVIDDYVRRGLDDIVLKYAQLGAKWQREQYRDACRQCDKDDDVAFYKGVQFAIKTMKEDAIERTVKEDAGGYPYIDETELYDYDNDEPVAKKGDKVKVYIFKN